ncbi:glycosyltransferase family 2 protein [Pseudanabaena sp. FACHB-1277]|uniref:Glycosyltransferase family 2 protein n=1 Tax=Pseudanabaena cinerea FACHB-1277 TaxID=2949581 RepID=A0A926UZ56_9CYAN|nr:glycosyltransferase family 2 protein [Pseudanabaena cinerea]MBD2152682.1 glycosyltransferase family 2 protein [Pseudanabaena cinerea FACHB-1277]
MAQTNIHSLNNKIVTLSVVVLCYRAGESIIGFTKALQDHLNSFETDWQLVLVGNYLVGSDDKTGDIILKMAQQDDKIKTIIKPKEGMMGWDMRMGMEHADGQYICVIDGDGQFPIESIGKAYKLIRENNVDVVKTFRVRRYDGAYRRFISFCYNIIFRILFPRLNSKDINSKPKIIRREAFDKLKLYSNDWFIDSEIMLEVRRLKLSFIEFPVVFHQIQDRRSFVKVSAILEFIRNLIIYRLRKNT